MENWEKFRDACIEENSIEELEEAHKGESDCVDCKIWDITHAQWDRAIVGALKDLKGE